MTTQLEVPESEFGGVLGHLDPRGAKYESAAFLIVGCRKSAGVLHFQWCETHKLEDRDFACRASDYLELTDDTRSGLIRRAHQLGGCLVEMHSHLGYWAAAFSEADLAGLAETVPHMLWRLQNRPYMAIVVARHGFDALVWDRPDSPMPLDQLVTGSRVLLPTNLTLQALQ